jgi:hypothetical protein
VLRVLLLVEDPDLSRALVAGLAAAGHSPTPADPAAAPEALAAAGWDVCIAEAAFASIALNAQSGRGLVVLAARGVPLHGLNVPRGPIVLRLPCSLEPLRDALLMASEVAPGPTSGAASPHPPASGGVRGARSLRGGAPLRLRALYAGAFAALGGDHERALDALGLRTEGDPADGHPPDPEASIWRAWVQASDYACGVRGTPQERRAWLVDKLATPLPPVRLADAHAHQRAEERSRDAARASERLLRLQARSQALIDEAGRRLQDGIDG